MSSDVHVLIDGLSEEPSETDVEVLIIGGGPAGLSAAIQLAQMEISSLVVERRDGTSKAPKAHYLNSRTMEIFAGMGIADLVYAQGSPAENLSTTTLYTTLGGAEPNDGRLIHQWDAFGGGALAESYSRTSAYPSGNLPQKHLEPLLRRCAEEVNPGRILFEHEVTSFEQSDERVVATVRSRSGERTVTARYAIAADGGNTIGPMLGVTMEGAPAFIRMIGVHFAADLSSYLQDDTSLIRAVVHPNSDGVLIQTAIVAMGPRHWDRHSEEWHLNIVVPVGDELSAAGWTDEMAVGSVREILNIADLECQILHISEWDIEGVLADKYRIGRTFFVGDAAHRHPPTTGLGLNTAVADVHNLTWKIAAVLKNQAGTALFDTYQVERRPVAARNVDWAMFTFFNHLAGQSGWGVLPGAPADANIAAYHATLADTPDGRARMARLKEFLGTQRAEYQARDVEMGYSYDGSAAVVSDGSDDVERAPLGTGYRQQTRPGSRLPHAWLERNGDRISTHHLLRTGEFLVLTGAQGDNWASAARSVSHELGIDATIVSIGDGDADYHDTGRTWQPERGHDDHGVLVVRPDGHVLYRSASRVQNPASALAAAFAAALGRQPVELQTAGIASPTG